MKNPRKIKYFLDEDKLFGLIFASLDQDISDNDPKLRNAILQEFKISYPDLENFNLNEYIQDFINGDLISDATAYQSYEKQRKLFAEEIARRKERYGWKGLKIREADIWKRYETRKEGRFLELISALQKEKYIEIITLAKDGGFIIDVLQKFQDFIAENNCYPTLEQNIKTNVGLIKNRRGNKQQPPSEPLLFQLGKQDLEINKNTGNIRLNKIKAILNPGSREFEILIKLATSTDYKATYEDLLSNKPTTINKRNLAFSIRNIKEALGILPKKNASNKDIIKNIKKNGYRLMG